MHFTKRRRELFYFWQSVVVGERKKQGDFLSLLRLGGSVLIIQSDDWLGERERYYVDKTAETCQLSMLI